MAGYGVALAVSKEFASSFPDRTFKSPLVELLVKNGRNGNINFTKHLHLLLFVLKESWNVFTCSSFDFLCAYGISGKNNGKGYYTYEKGSKPKPDLSVLPIIEESRRITNMMPGGKVFSLFSFHSHKLVL